MSTKVKSEALQYLEKLSGRALTFGSLMESIRESEGITQREMAKKLKATKSYICDIEKGRKAVSASKAAAFAKVLRRSESQFIRLAFQDELERSGLNFKVSVDVA